jgi:hypothetical protein
MTPEQIEKWGAQADEYSRKHYQICETRADEIREMARVRDTEFARLARADVLGPLNDDLIAILGRPSFACNDLADALRVNGHIEHNAELERVAVLHWLLGHYLRHGDKWAEVARIEMTRLRAIRDDAAKWAK